MLRTRAVQLRDLLRVGTVRVERAELAAGVPEQHQEVLALRAGDFFEHPPFGFRVHRAGEHAVLHRVQHDAAIGLRRRLLI